MMTEVLMQYMRKTLLLTKSSMADAKSLQCEANSVQNPVCEMQDKTIESFSTGATSILDTKVVITRSKCKLK
jgi:hypothetical protein